MKRFWVGFGIGSIISLLIVYGFGIQNPLYCISIGIGCGFISVAIAIKIEKGSDRWMRESIKDGKWCPKRSY